MIVQFYRSMARPHVPHDGTRDTCSRPRERFTSCGHLPVPDVRGQRTGSESSERRRYRGQAEHLQVKSHPGWTIVSSPTNRPSSPSLSRIKTIGTPMCDGNRARSIFSSAHKKKNYLTSKRIPLFVVSWRMCGCIVGLDLNCASCCSFEHIDPSRTFFFFRERIRLRV